MKALIKFLRGLLLINWVVRMFIKYTPFNKTLGKYWPVKGVESVKIAGQSIKFYSNCDDRMFSNLFYDPKSFEIREINLFTAIAAQFKNFIDIGANTGLYTSLTGKLRPDATIFAFEPHPQNFARLLKNVELNEIKNAKLYNNAVGSINESVEFFVPKDDSITDVSSFSQEFSEGITNQAFYAINVDTLSLDNFFIKKNLDGQTLIKIDVEGFELEVLKGGLGFIKKHQPVIICEIFTRKFENEVEYKIQLPKVYEFEQLMKSLKYTIYQISKRDKLNKVNTLNQSIESNNLLFVPLSTDYFNLLIDS